MFEEENCENHIINQRFLKIIVTHGLVAGEGAERENLLCIN